ncbi:MAG: AAA family ATPase [Bacteroidia bacterium]|nr:AAA family ATPase [Bacteroidia bacterium]
MTNLAIGISDFKQVREGQYYYVDKSLFIKEIIDDSLVILLTRPRRFGKTINLSLLRYFFEKTDQDTSYLFKDLNIWQAGERYTSRQGQYPVISLTFKSIKETNWAKTYEGLRNILAIEFERHNYILESNLFSNREIDLFTRIANGKASEVEYKTSLRTLSSYLQRYHQQRVVILIDEYDTPINTAYLYNFYEDTTLFIRGLFEGAYKDNNSLEKGVITGIFRVAKEGIFSGLNNLSEYSVLNFPFADKFGFTEAEVKQLLADYNLSDKLEGVRTWYDGYQFGRESGIYNPWSIIKYAKDHEEGFKTHWVNTSDNALITELIVGEALENRQRLLELIDGQGFCTRVSESVIFRAYATIRRRYGRCYSTQAILARSIAAAMRATNILSTIYLFPIGKCSCFSRTLFGGGSGKSSLTSNCA